MRYHSILVLILLYADDVVLLAESEKDLQALIDFMSQMENENK